MTASGHPVWLEKGFDSSEYLASHLLYCIVLNERHLMRMLNLYFAYYHEARTHLSLNRDSPVEREVEPPELGKVIATPQVGGVHHRYTRAA